MKCFLFNLKRHNLVSIVMQSALGLQEVQSELGIVLKGRKYLTMYSLYTRKEDKGWMNAMPKERITTAIKEVLDAEYGFEIYVAMKNGDPIMKHIGVRHAKRSINIL